jgi:hypothetical protein
VLRDFSPDFGNKYLFKRIALRCMFTFWTSHAGAAYKTANRLDTHDDTGKGNR